ncbi:MAG: hypothetical protein P8L66_03215 [Rhodospirillaceae bacterium]|nr:hypothetical protein [Rhodospirillaceae bacterium]
MAFSFNEDKPSSPAVARILNFMGWTSIVGCVCGIMLAFSGYPRVNDIYATAGPGAVIILGVLFIGQAKTLEAFTIRYARMKSRSAVLGRARLAALGESIGSKSISPPIIPQRKERTGKISADDTHPSGVTPRSCRRTLIAVPILHIG